MVVLLERLLVVEPALVDDTGVVVRLGELIVTLVRVLERLDGAFEPVRLHERPAAQDVELRRLGILRDREIDVLHRLLELPGIELLQRLLVGEVRRDGVEPRPRVGASFLTGLRRPVAAGDEREAGEADGGGDGLTEGHAFAPNGDSCLHW